MDPCQTWCLRKICIFIYWPKCGKHQWILSRVAGEILWAKQAFTWFCIFESHLNTTEQDKAFLVFWNADYLQSLKSYEFFFVAEFGHKYPTNVKIFDEYAMRLKFFGELRFGFFGIPIFFSNKENNSIFGHCLQFDCLSFFSVIYPSS